MKILKSICIAFSIYSKIPMPQFPWKEKDMEYMLCFFPWIGAVLGVVFFGWSSLCRHFEISEIARCCIQAFLPILITGGFHMDGFMDTMDALHSYQSKERKLEILKDSHIGAFAVITLAGYFLLELAALSQVEQLKGAGVIACGFFLSRALSGIGIVCLTPAKKNGSLYTFASSAQKKVVSISLLVQFVLGVLVMCLLDVRAGICNAVVMLFWFGYYRYKMQKEFGGITGDTAGYFVTIAELLMIITTAVLL